jgi:poly-gamma-glutamate system protein
MRNAIVISSYKGGPQKIPGVWLKIFGITLLALIVNQSIRHDRGDILHDTMRSAAKIMSRAQNGIKTYRRGLEIPINPGDDPNQTGLIGDYYTEITTTAGNLEAKRTTTNPNFAALIVALFYESGVRNGDSIAIGSSGSFPALVLATLSAAKAMNLQPVIITSLGSSMWGSNNTRMTWLDMYYELYEKGIFAYKIDAASIGGDMDVGLELSDKGRKLIIAKIKKYQVPFIYEPNLRVNVEKRLKVYDAGCKDRPIKAFVNIGGAAANTGVNAMMLDLKPGINHIHKYPPVAESGVLFEMGKRNIPVIHLLNLKGFSLKYGMPWDPIPLPAAGQGAVYQRFLTNDNKGKQIGLILLYFGTVAGMILWERKSGCRS